MKRKIIRFFDVVIGIVSVSCIFALLSASGVYADVVDTVTVTVPVSCSMTGTVDSAHTATVEVGTYTENIGETTFKVLCNDSSGFAVYAIGYSDDTYGNTTMKPTTLPATNGIATGTATSGDTSNWAMKLTAVSGDYTPTLTTGFNIYHAVPAEYTKVASLASNTDATVGSSFKSTYAAFVSQAQAADTYVGKVKYTVVHPSTYATPEAVSVMQNLSSASCTSTPSRVADNRDGHIYTIQRLLDGNCWMMENLDLGRTELTTDLTSENTNLSTTVTASTFNSWKKETPESSYDAGVLIPITASNSSDGLDTDPISNTLYGTLYNFYAASAGTISGSANSNNAEYDICPAGWRLPTGGNSGEYLLLRTFGNYNEMAVVRASVANNGIAFARAGYMGDSELLQQGGVGNYWSSVKSSDTRVYGFNVTSSDSSTVPTVSPTGYRKGGFSIRCIMKELVMQNVSSWGSSVEEGEEVVVKDARDGKKYTVARLADGNLWMTQNLDFNIDSTKTYTSADTDIPANWTPSTSTYITEVTTWNGTNTLPESYDPGHIYWNGTLASSYGGAADNYVSSTGDNHYHIGNLYNWTAAVAMNDTSMTPDSTNIDQSICPAGWALPRAGFGDDSFYALISEYDTWDSTNHLLTNNTQLWNTPFHLPLSGYYLGGSLRGVGSEGVYWSSTYHSTGAGPYSVYFDYNGSVHPGVESGGLTGGGVAVRCVARPVINIITYTQP